MTSASRTEESSARHRQVSVSGFREHVYSHREPVTERQRAKPPEHTNSLRACVHGVSDGFSRVTTSKGYAQVPTYEFTPVKSSIKFGVESSVSIKGIFEKWNASIKFSSRDVRSAVLDIEIEAGSLNTGSQMKDNKLKGKDFFNVKESHLITFKSTKILQAGPNTFDIEGNFTISRRYQDGETHSHER